MAPVYRGISTQAGLGVGGCEAKIRHEPGDESSGGLAERYSPVMNWVG